MSTLLERLPGKAQRGSKPRCHFMTHGSRDAVARRLTALAKPFATVAPSDRWMPEGFEQLAEAELHKAHTILSPADCEAIKRWWFAVYRGGLQTGPSFDIAGTCTIEGRPGILLVEAKAHDQELIGEGKGKPVPSGSPNSHKNHQHIAGAIADAARQIERDLQIPCSLACDSHYQMSNRLATACKLTSLGYPVALVYLGFLDADEMRDKGLPLSSHEHWRDLVKAHSAPLFPSNVWDRSWMLNGQPFIPLIRSSHQALSERGES